MSHTYTAEHLPRVFHPFTAKMAFWLSVAGTAIQSGLMLVGNVYTDAQIVDRRFHLVLVSVETFALFFLLFLFNFYIMRRQWSVHKRFLVAVGGTLVVSCALLYAAQGMAFLLYDEAVNDELTYLDIIRDSIVALTVVLVTAALFNIHRRQQIALENELLQAENLQVRLDALENQVDPHFLFNSLGTLDGLIGIDDDRAHTYLHQLASTYRYIMQQQRVVTLADELAFAQSYIYLMQIRYGSNLQVQQHIAPEAMEANILPISLQLLLENAIKHNVVSDRHPLTVTIESTPRATLRVSNPRQPKEGDDPGQGIGLTNLSKRCQLIFHRDIVIYATESLFAVEVPLSS